MTFARRLPVGIAVLAILTACGADDDSNTVRGRGLNVSQLSAIARAHVYEAALRAAFDVDDPSLSLLLDSRELPRGVGLAPGGTIPDTTTSEMRRRGVTKGACQPPLEGKRGPTRCSAALPGYVVRFSPVFMLRGDSVQVYLYAQKYDTPGSAVTERLRFERAYQVVRRGDDWRAVREGRVPKEIRGEPK